MRTFSSFLTDAFRQQPPELVESLTPWIIGILGAAMLGIMAYAWLTAWLS